MVAGCGGDDGPPTPERAQSCLSEQKGVTSAESISAGQPDISSLTTAQRKVLQSALRLSDEAISVRSGGPVEDDGGIADAPVGVSELHFFPSDAEAEAAARAIEQTAGSPDDSVLNGVRALGPVLVVHYSFGIGDRPGGIGIERDLKPVEDCLRETGYLNA